MMTEKSGRDIEGKKESDKDTESGDTKRQRDTGTEAQTVR